MDIYSNDVKNDRYLSHFGIKGQKWGIRRFQAYGSGGYDRKDGKTGRVIRLEGKIAKTRGKISKNNTKLEKLNSYENVKRNRRLELKKSKLEIKRAKLSKRVNKAKTKKEIRGADPNWFERRAIRKAYKLDTKISRIVRKQNTWKMKVSKLEYQNAELENKVDRYLERLDKFS